MMKKNMEKALQKGSLMVEALALLGLITMVTPIMYKKAAERTTELQDINVATQMRTINDALDSFVRNNYDKLETVVADGAKLKVLLTEESSDVVKGVKSFLPAGFDLSQSKYFDPSKVQFSIDRKDISDLMGNKRKIYTAAVLAPALNDVNLSRASKIASMIGVNGGTFKNISNKFEGTQGVWNADPSVWFKDIDVSQLKPGSLMSISTEAISESASTSSKVLFRDNDGDETKSTMVNDLIMGGKNIRNIGALFGAGNTLTIAKDGGGDLTELLIKGATNITGALAVGGNTTVGGTLGVTGDTTVGGTLGVTGDTTLSELEADASKLASLEVTTNATVGGTLSVDGDTALNKLTAGETTLGNTSIGGTLGVTGNTTLKDTTVDGTLIVTNLLDLPGGLKVDNISSHTAGGTIKLNDPTEVSGTLGVTGNATVGGTLGVTGKTTLGELKAGKTTLGNTTVEGTLSVTGDTTVGGTLSAKKLHADESITLGDNILVADDSEFNVKYGVSNINFNKDEFELGVSDGTNNESAILADHGSLGLTAGSDESTVDIGLNSGEEPAIELFVRNDDTLIDAQVVIDEYGMAVGKGVTRSSGGRTVTSETLDTNKYGVIISRKGFVEIAPPIGENAGQERGYIKARRLVSDVEYPGGAFDGLQSDGSFLEDGKKFDYYQVNPAYTSVMNDIKLASRGGARLSDLLSDYVIKGIYVADNTYNEGVGLDWDAIPLGEGAPQDGVWESVGEYTKCDGEGACKIASCTAGDCVASPWMGFVPRPQCPFGYQAVVGTTPIRWRMSEVFSVKSSFAEVPTQNDYKQIIGDATNADGTNIESDNSFAAYFGKNNDPKAALYSLADHTEGDTYVHKYGGQPYTFQTNTWLNTSVSPHYNDDGDIDGWHVLMGFLYKPSEYGTLLGDIGLSAGEEELVWNIFPVYYQEMAAIVTAYCAFTRFDYDSGMPKWGAPVMDYDQLSKDHYKDGTGHDRGNETWKNSVLDPTLPFEDAW